MRTLSTVLGGHTGLDACFVGDKMFACISGEGVGLRLPAANSFFASVAGATLTILPALIPAALGKAPLAGSQIIGGTAFLRAWGLFALAALNSPNST